MSETAGAHCETSDERYTEDLHLGKGCSGEGQGIVGVMYSRGVGRTTEVSAELWKMSTDR